MQLVPLDQIHAHIDRETGRSEWFEIAQDRIDAFADVTEDHQWIHVDPDAAESGPFGATIAHGFLTLSLLSHLNGQAAMLPDGGSMYVNYGLDRLRFLNPVPAGSRIRAISTLKGVDADRSDGNVLVKAEVTVEIEGADRPALVAELLTLVVVNG